MEKFPIYGGPLSGAEAENAATVYCDRDDVLPPFQTADSPGWTPPRFEYDLVGDGDRRAFLPREDRDLLRAYHATDGKPGDRAAGVLLAEIERRGLEI